MFTVTQDNQIVASFRNMLAAYVFASSQSGLKVSYKE